MTRHLGMAPGLVGAPAAIRGAVGRSLWLRSAPTVSRAV